MFYGDRWWPHLLGELWVMYRNCQIGVVYLKLIELCVFQLYSNFCGGKKSGSPEVSKILQKQESDHL